MLPFSNAGQRAEGLTVMGEATRTAQPDIVELSLDVHSAAPVASQALRDNAARVMQIGHAVTSMGIPQQELQAGAATLYPIYQPFGAPLNPLPVPPGFGTHALMPLGVQALTPFGAGADGPQLVGYHVVSFLKLSLSDVAKLGDVVDAATRAGANIGNGFLFRLRDEPAIRRGLMEDAGRDAREKADALASVLGKTTGDPVSVSEDFSTYQVGPVYGNGYRGGPFTLTPAGTIARLPFSPGELSFHARVSVTYRIQ